MKSDGISSHFQRESGREAADGRRHRRQPQGLGGLLHDGLHLEGVAHDGQVRGGRQAGQEAGLHHVVNLKGKEKCSEEGKLSIFMLIKCKKKIRSERKRHLPSKEPFEGLFFPRQRARPALVRGCGLGGRRKERRKTSFWRRQMRRPFRSLLLLPFLSLSFLRGRHLQKSSAHSDRESECEETWRKASLLLVSFQVKLPFFPPADNSSQP